VGLLVYDGLYEGTPETGRLGMVVEIKYEKFGFPYVVKWFNTINNDGEMASGNYTIEGIQTMRSYYERVVSDGNK